MIFVFLFIVDCQRHLLVSGVPPQVDSVLLCPPNFFFFSSSVLLFQRKNYNLKNLQTLAVPYTIFYVETPKKFGFSEKFKTPSKYATSKILMAQVATSGHPWLVYCIDMLTVYNKNYLLTVSRYYLCLLLKNYSLTNITCK